MKFAIQEAACHWFDFEVNDDLHCFSESAQGDIIASDEFDYIVGFSSAKPQQRTILTLFEKTEVEQKKRQRSRKIKIHNNTIYSIA